MNQSIQEVANFMTYDGLLECGNDEVAGKLVQLNPEGNKDIWPECVPELARDAVVAFFDTSQLSDGTFRQKEDELGICNFGEAELVGKLTKLASHMETNDGKNASIGVMAPYRSQVSTLQKKLTTLPPSDISTVDQFQGRDKDVIIYSCTRTKVAKSGRKNAGSDIMSDWRRLNVAVTRAKARLWMIGNVDTLKNYAPFKKLLDYLASKDLIFQLTDI
jgi:DNA replication ATP-dependent helicase Dna2